MRTVSSDILYWYVCHVVRLMVTVLLVPVVWMGSLETRYLVQGSTVGHVRALVTLDQIISMPTPVKLTTPPTRSSVTADVDILVDQISL